MNKQIVVGCIADDFTGASDAASFLAKAGLRTVLFNGIPTDSESYGKDEIEAAVVALKTRTQETASAVEDSMKALSWLKEMGAKYFYSKYCSTFDSTPKGNIGPVMDAALELTGAKASILCPALPVNERVVKDGCLYVNGVPLHESPMKNHPLTPMWEADIEKLMEPQSAYPCIKINRDKLYNLTKEEIWKELDEFGKDKEHYYIIPDYVEEGDAKRLTEVFGDMILLSGGSGILTELGRRHKKNQDRENEILDGTKGKALILAGSCSVATLGQIDTYQNTDNYSYKIDPMKLLGGELNAGLIWERVMRESWGKEILIYSSDSAKQVKEIQKKGADKAAHIIEQTMADLAVLAVENSYTRIIVAGGETSGAVTKALGFDSYYIGKSIAPGVPVMVPLKSKDIRLVLKSGNFGQSDFFMRALEDTQYKGGFNIG